MEEEKIENTRDSDKPQIKKTSKVKIIKTKFSNIKINKLFVFLLLVFFILLLTFSYLLKSSQENSVSISGWKNYDDEYLSFEYPSNYFIKKYDQQSTQAGDKCIYILDDNELALEEAMGFDNGKLYIPYKSPEHASNIFPHTSIIINTCNFIFSEEGLSVDEKLISYAW